MIDPVGGGSQAREDRSHRGLGPGCLGNRMVEDNGPVAKPVDLGRHAARIAVEPQMIGSHRVDDVDENIGTFSRGEAGGCLGGCLRSPFSSARGLDPGSEEENRVRISGQSCSSHGKPDRLFLADR